MKKHLKSVVAVLLCALISATSMSLSVGAEGTGMLDWFVEQTLVYEDLYAMGTVDSWLAKDNNNQYGIIDNYGTVVYPFDTYSNMEHEPQQGKSPDIFALTPYIIRIKKDGKIFYINNDGNLITDTAYDNVCNIADTLLCVEKDGKRGVIDKDGNMVLNIEYTLISSLHDCVLAVTRESDMNIALVDYNGNFLRGFNDCTYSEVHNSDELISMNIEIDHVHYTHFLDIYGRTVTEFDDFYPDARRLTDHLYAVGDMHGGYSIASIDGTILLETKYISISRFTDNLFICTAKVEENGINKYKSGIIDLMGNIVIPFDHLLLSKVTDDLLWGEKNGNYMLFDIDGNVIYSRNKSISSVTHAGNGIYIIGSSPYGAVDRSGNTVIDFKHSSLRPFSDTFIKSEYTTLVNIKDKTEITDCKFFDSSSNPLPDGIYMTEEKNNCRLFIGTGEEATAANKEYRKIVYNKGDNTYAFKGARGNNKWGIARISEPSKLAPAVIPSFRITINGTEASNRNALYPCIVHNGITYFPMTYFNALSLGLAADYTAQTGLVIKKTGTAPYAPEFEQNSIENTVDQTAVTVTGNVTINGKKIDNSTEEYPLLLFRDITYFPLTWRFAVEEFGWQYEYTDENGLVINASGQ